MRAIWRRLHPRWTLWLRRRWHRHWWPFGILGKVWELRQFCKWGVNTYGIMVPFFFGGQTSMIPFTSYSRVHQCAKVLTCFDPIGKSIPKQLTTLTTLERPWARTWRWSSPAMTPFRLLAFQKTLSWLQTPPPFPSPSWRPKCPGTQILRLWQKVRRIWYVTTVTTNETRFSWRPERMIGYLGRIWEKLHHEIVLFNLPWFLEAPAWIKSTLGMHFMSDP